MVRFSKTAGNVNNERNLNPVLAIFHAGQLYFGAPQLPGDQATCKI